MRPARLAARALALLGPVAGPVAVVAPRAGRLAAALAAQTALASDSAPPAAGIVSFLGAPAHPADRQAALRLLGQRLPAGAPLVLVDHNQPRVLWRRALGIVVLAAARFAPSRARYPAARELAALGFAVERLRLACGERVQLVLARRPETFADPRPCLGWKRTARMPPHEQGERRAAAGEAGAADFPERARVTLRRRCGRDA